MQGLNALYGAIQLFAVLSVPVTIVVGLVARRRHRRRSAPQRRRLVALDLALALSLLGFALRLRPLGWTPTIIAVVATSILIEVVQALLPLGRTTNVDDVLLNAVGGILGAALASLALRTGRCSS